MNRPPRIDPLSLRPDPKLGPVAMEVACPVYPFKASVSDPDGDTLYWRYFVDYHVNQDDLLRVDATPLAADPTGGGRAITFDVTPPNEPLFGIPPRLSEPHTIELLVSDRPFFPGDRTPDDEDGLLDSFIWTVQLQDNTDPDCPVDGGP